MEAVLHRESFAQELGVPHDRRARGSLGEHVGELGSRPDGHSRLADDDVALGDELERAPGMPR